MVSWFSVFEVSNSLARKKSEGWGAMQYPQLVLGMIAIFTYVGVEVTIQGNLPELLKTEAFGLEGFALTTMEFGFFSRSLF